MKVVKRINDLVEKEGSKFLVSLCVLDEETKTVTTIVETHDFLVNDLNIAMHQIGVNIKQLLAKETPHLRTVEEVEKMETVEELKGMLE